MENNTEYIREGLIAVSPEYMCAGKEWEERMGDEEWSEDIAQDIYQQDWEGEK